MSAESDHRDEPTGPDADLVAMLADVEAQVEHLRAELARRRRYRDQHDEIDRLGEHLEAARVNWEQVREFLLSAIRETRTGGGWQEAAPDAHLDPAEGPASGGEERL